MLHFSNIINVNKVWPQYVAHELFLNSFVNFNPADWSLADLSHLYLGHYEKMNYKVASHMTKCVSLSAEQRRPQ